MIAPESVTRFRSRGLFYHQGHGWLRPEPAPSASSADDFAQKFIGKIDAVDLPRRLPAGAGDKGWSLVVDGVPIRCCRRWPARSSR